MTSTRLSAWLDLLKFNWLRRCRACGVRGSKCLCRRPSLALEHIFFLEERKNKFGARNFSHVSDTFLTSTSTTLFAHSAASASGGSTVVMWHTASFLDSEVNPTDYYYDGTATTAAAAAGAPPQAFSASACSRDRVTPRGHEAGEAPRNRLTAHRNQVQHRSSSLAVATSDACVPATAVTATAPATTATAATAASTTTLVRKQSGRMVTRATRRHCNDPATQPPIKEIVTGEFVPCTDENVPVSLLHRRQHKHKQVLPHHHHHHHHQQQQQQPHQSRSRAQSKSSSAMGSLRRPQYKEEPGVSFQFYGRGGHAAPPGSVSSALMGSSRSVCSSCSSTTDSFGVGPSSASTSVRASQCSSRVSLETNFGSLNPPSYVTTKGGRFLDGGYAPSIQENDEAQALQQLTGWFLASSIPTTDSCTLSR
ncbi:unnamed protein product [Hyaloperonospora brassicae]|uniref:PNPLA domain-containing protein n=1 Tax=Hyaloperonospora brassicae TaxID=162125 RepID=A0AAV0T0B9_HYABA|nr:unnamed protein product [Hyaloperonospora brassicae]